MVRFDVQLRQTYTFLFSSFSLTSKYSQTHDLLQSDFLILVVSGKVEEQLQLTLKGLTSEMLLLLYSESAISFWEQVVPE